MAEVIVPFRRRIAVVGDPDTVFAQLRDPERLIQCVAGGQLTQVVNPRAFKGHLNVGPFALPYSGVGHITLSGPDRQQSTIALEGHGPVGAGSVFAEVTLSVEGYSQGLAFLSRQELPSQGLPPCLEPGWSTTQPRT
jgi:carbon monoxide dehydrogenase subunit G